jgi:hypothetical protein
MESKRAQQMAGPESPRTIRLCDRIKDDLTLSEVERIPAVTYLIETVIDDEDLTHDQLLN